MCKAYTDAYMAFGNHMYFSMALKNADFLSNTQMQEDCLLWHSYKNGKSSINGFLEDYAFCIAAFIRLYESTFDEHWLGLAQKLTDYTLVHFKDEKSKMFFFTSNLDYPLIARKMEVNDNVIPASCSEMANNLFLLGHYLNKTDYINHSRTMLNNVKEKLPTFGSGYSNWAMLFLNQVVPFYEIAIVGEESLQKAWNLNQEYHPNKLLIGCNKESSLHLLKKINNRQYHYLCLCEKSLSASHK